MSAADTTLVATSVRSVTIGSSHSVGKNSANMSFTSSATTTMGAAFSASGESGSWEKSGSKTVAAGWSTSWRYSSDPRIHRIRVEYGKYRYQYWSCGYPYKTEYKWLPRTETGGTRTVSAKRPNWNTCALLAKDIGTWSRDRTDGSDYTAAGGVKIKGLIGINLSTRRSYSSASKVTYKVFGAQKRMCGINRYPSVAGKVRMRFA